MDFRVIRSVVRYSRYHAAAQRHAVICCLLSNSKSRQLGSIGNLSTEIDRTHSCLFLVRRPEALAAVLSVQVVVRVVVPLTQHEVDTFAYE